MTYAVLWCSGSEPIRAGRLDLTPVSLVLEGSSLGDTGRHEVAYADISTIGIGRTQDERLRGRPVALIEETDGCLLRIASLGGAGLLGELVERVDEARAAART